MSTIDDRDEPLREDVRILGALVGDMLREQEGETFYQWVEATRRASIAARDPDRAADSAVGDSDLFDPATTEQQEKRVRAFSAYFAVVNMAEQIHRLRRRRDYERSGAQPDGPRALFASWRHRGVDAARARVALDQLHLEPVFTAHPTEAVRGTLLRKQQRIARALVDRIEPNALTPVEDRRALDRVAEEVHIAWRTEEHLAVRPTLESETEHVLFYLSRVIYRIVPSLYESFESAFEETYGESLECPPFLRFASWVGGDMDGNPAVGARTIAASFAAHRSAILALYAAEVDDLADRLSHSLGRASFTDALLERGAALESALPEVLDTLPVRHRDMPYRRLLRCMAALLRAARNETEPRYVSPQDFEQDLTLIEQCLLQHRGPRAGLHRVRRSLRRLRTFGFHFATLDTRQDSAVHRAVCGALLGVSDFAEHRAVERAALLRTALAGPFEGVVPAEAEATVEVFRTLSRMRAEYGAHAVGPSIVSMAEGADDGLAVLFLARAGSFVEDGAVPLDVAPLFETVHDLHNAAATLGELLADPHYREHLRARGDRQVLMLGYSDSGKDSGIAAARWALYRAQEELVRVAVPHGVELVLFHGRGGTVSRGGSKITEAIPAQPPGSVRSHLRVTEQGEIIHGRYGMRGIAQRTLEVAATAVMKFSIDESTRSGPTDDQRAVLDTFAEASRTAYRALVHHDPDFFAFFRSATPIDVIERMNLGSRPPSRRTQRGIADLRAIPWVFAWTQCRLMLPGWYGVAQGLEAAERAHGRAQLQSAAEQCPVLRTLLSDVEMVMAKAQLAIAERYALLATDGAAQYARLRQEFEQTAERILDLRGATRLLDREPWLQRAIQLRNPYIDPMSFAQVDLLRQWRACGRDDPALERALFSTVQGISRGLMNTG